MDSYDPATLGTLKLPALRSLCVQARNEGRLAAKTKCNGSRDTLIALLGGVSTQPPDPTTQPSPTSQVDHIASDSPHSPLYIPDDILYNLAMHTPYTTMLTLLAARPTNNILLRALYDPSSVFWHHRLGVFSGRGCLVDKETGLVAKEALWTYKVQHDAVVPREGNLILTGLPAQVDPSDTPNEGIYTDKRIRGVVCNSMTSGWGRPPKRIRLRNGETMITLHYIIVTEEGRLQYLEHDMDVDIGWEDAMRTIVANESEWHDLSFQSANGEILPIAPRIKVMVECNVHIVCLDYEGRIWLISNAYTIHSSEYRGAAQAVELQLPPLLAEEGPVLSIVQTTWFSDESGASIVEENDRCLTHALVLTLAGNIREYILFLDQMKEAHDTRQDASDYQDRPEVILPRLVPIAPEVSSLAHTWFRPTTHEITEDDIPVTPYGPRLILYNTTETSEPRIRQNSYKMPKHRLDMDSLSRRTDDEYIDIYSDDVVDYYELSVSKVLVTRIIIDHQQYVIAPTNNMGAATVRDVQDAIESIGRRPAESAHCIVIPIIPNWIMGRMGVGLGEAMLTWFPSPATTPPYLRNSLLHPYVWATTYYDGCGMGPSACLMPNGTAYELIPNYDDEEDTMPRRTKVVVVRDPVPEYGNYAEEYETRFLQIYMAGGAIGRMCGVGV